MNEQAGLLYVALGGWAMVLVGAVCECVGMERAAVHLTLAGITTLGVAALLVILAASKSTKPIV